MLRTGFMSIGMWEKWAIFFKWTMKLLVSIKCGGFLEQLRNYQIFKIDYVLWS
jgi:hypothetical protein